MATTQQREHERRNGVDEEVDGQRWMPSGGSTAGVVGGAGNERGKQGQENNHRVSVDC